MTPRPYQYGTKRYTYDDSYVWEWIDGASLSCLTTGQIWDASCWTRQDWNEFRAYEGDRTSWVENMDEYASWEDLRDGKKIQ